MSDKDKRFSSFLTYCYDGGTTKCGALVWFDLKCWERGGFGLNALSYRRTDSSTNTYLDRLSVKIFAGNLVRLYFCVSCIGQSTTAGFPTCLARLREYVRGRQRFAPTSLAFDAVFSPFILTLERNS